LVRRLRGRVGSRDPDEIEEGEEPTTADTDGLRHFQLRGSLAFRELGKPFYSVANFYSRQAQLIKLLQIKPKRRPFLPGGLALLLVPLSKPHPGATPVLVDELDTRAFECAAKSLVIGRCQRSLIFSQFGPADCSYAYSGMSRQILGTPPDKRPGSPQLCAGKRVRHLDGFIPYDMIYSI